MRRWQMVESGEGRRRMTAAADECHAEDAREVRGCWRAGGHDGRGVISGTEECRVERGVVG